MNLHFQTIILFAGSNNYKSEFSWFFVQLLLCFLSKIISKIWKFLVHGCWIRWHKITRAPLNPDWRHVERPPPSLQITSNFPVFMGFHMVPLLKRRVWRFFRAGPNGPSPATHFWQKNSTIPPPSSNFVI